MYMFIYLSHCGAHKHVFHFLIFYDDRLSVSVAYCV